MNFYTENFFGDALSTAYFSDDCQIESKIFKLNGKLWKIPTINSNQPLTEFPFASTFIDFYEPQEEQSDRNSDRYPEVSYIPKACHKLVTANEWFDRELTQTYEPAPTIMWDRFDTWSDFEGYVRQKRSNLFSDSRRRFRKLEQNFGKIEFIFDDRRANILDICMRWKSAQYLRSGYLDLFANAQHRNLFQAMFDRGSLLVSTLNAGDRLMAVHLGIRSAGRLYWWIPAYDPADGTYSPGRLLLELLLKESFNRQDREFDFLIGDEDYKWYYATHVRAIAQMGTPPMSIQLKRAVKSSIKPFISSTIGQFPALNDSLKDVRSKLKQKIYESTKSKP
jgi:hypothetical protein